MNNKQSDEFAQAIKKLTELHREIHQDDEKPKNNIEEQAAVVKDGFQRVIMHLIYTDECSIRIIELSLFYFWHHLFVRSVNLEPEADNLPLDQTLPKAIQFLSKITARIEDDGQDEKMAELGNILEQLKQTAYDMGERPRTKQQTQIETEKTNQSIVELINLFIDHGVSPLLVQNWLFYYWVRSSTITANADEKLFQKIERNWPEVIDAFNPVYLGFIRSCIEK